LSQFLHLGSENLGGKEPLDPVKEHRLILVGGPSGAFFGAGGQVRLLLFFNSGDAGGETLTERLVTGLVMMPSNRTASTRSYWGRRMGEWIADMISLLLFLDL
jgi:hypothetical protein